MHQATTRAPGSMQYSLHHDATAPGQQRGNLRSAPTVATGRPCYGLQPSCKDPSCCSTRCMRIMCPAGGDQLSLRCACLRGVQHLAVPVTGAAAGRAAAGTSAELHRKLSQMKWSTRTWGQSLLEGVLSG